jgi:hypothetical protein
MLRHMTLAAAAIFIAAPAAPAMADDTCLSDRGGEQCDIFMGEYRVDETPVGTTNVWSTRPFVIENFHYLDSGNRVFPRSGGDVLYWDGESAMVVSEDAGPQVKIADW